MPTELTYTSRMMPCGDFGPETSVPDLLPQGNLQNKQTYLLDETDEIYEGYGKLSTAYPYRSHDVYTRDVPEQRVLLAVLENDLLRAEFLPEYGGRLWTLYDKTMQRNLLYTNDVLRPSNLATRNAWFSGGVEWNIGVIGHTPLTAEPMFTASLKTPEGLPVLRMYEYERIRGVVYQMDFWLDENVPVLYAAMRIVNPNDKLIPMYWWSNIAVPEYENGRIFAPATKAYTSDLTSVSKVDVPMVDGVDISHYKDIPWQVDYFFDIPEESPKFIANIDEDGYGLLHASTKRLRSRKLFSWGNSEASGRWQAFLTQNAGRYVEIQAGLGKTQYGCIPMAPHTTWDWLEIYGPMQLTSKENESDFLNASASLAKRVGARQAFLQQGLEAARKFAKQPAAVKWEGSGYAALENAARQKRGLDPMCPHLDFLSSDTRQSEWYALLKTGFLPTPAEDEAPGDFMIGSYWLSLTERAAARTDATWYSCYQLGLMLWQQQKFTLAKAVLERADAMDSNAWTLHALAVLRLREGAKEEAARLMANGMLLRREDLSYLKTGMRLLRYAEAWDLICEMAELLPADGMEEPRMRLSYIEALYHVGEYEAARALLLEEEGFEIPDLREGEVSIGRLWRDIHNALHECEDEPIPYLFNFDSLPPNKA